MCNKNNKIKHYLDMDASKHLKQLCVARGHSVACALVGRSLDHQEDLLEF